MSDVSTLLLDDPADSQLLKGVKLASKIGEMKANTLSVRTSIISDKFSRTWWILQGSHSVALRNISCSWEMSK